MRFIIRLNVSELMKAAEDKGIETDTQLAAAIGVSFSHLWRTKLKPNHPQYCAPGTAFIAGVLSTFGGPFERFFFLADELRDRNHQGDSKIHRKEESEHARAGRQRL